MRLLTLVLLLAALFTCARASTDTPSAEALLQQMQRAYHHYNFELSLIKVRQGTIEPLRFSHAVSEESELSHLIYLNGRPSEYLKRNNEISFFEAGSDPYTLSGARMPGFWSAVLGMNLEQVLKSYDPVVTGRNRIAGLPVQVVRLAPKDPSKYGFVLWLEQASGLLLRLDLIDEGGNLVEQFMGVDLRIMPEPSSWLLALDKVTLPRAVTTEQAYQAPQQELGWAPGWLPKGFRVMSTDRHPLVGTGEMVDYMMVSDGLVDVSIYLSAPESGMGEQLVRQGATSLLRLLNDHKVEVTVVGEVPAQTAQRIAESLHSLAKGVRP
ncbi:MucB/RseB C-terminal domain-containing protein [Pseudaeromonas pectinilytica]|nr:MucB/RseB C-terminal domain-containing protein [Aeromonadaceae bacterium]